MMQDKDSRWLTEPSLNHHHHQLVNHTNPPFHIILNFDTQFVLGGISNKSEICIPYLSQQNWILLFQTSYDWRTHHGVQQNSPKYCQRINNFWWSLNSAHKWNQKLEGCQINFRLWQHDSYMVISKYIFLRLVSMLYKLYISTSHVP